jgi:hypothetical protein
MLELTAWQLIVWALKDCQAAKIIEGATKVTPRDYIPRHSADGVFAVARQQELEATVQVGAPMSASVLNDDAFTVYMALRGELDRNQFHAVRDYGTKGQVPNWRPDLKPIEARPVLVERKHRLIPQVVRNLKYCGDFCPVYYADRSDEILAFRLHYSTWFAGIEIAGGYFEAEGAAMLKRHKVKGIGAIRAPWTARDRGL